MEDIKVNDYIRTKDGIIARVTRYDDLMLDCDRDVFDLGYLAMMEIPVEYIQEYVMKHSKNIIDLIEIGDFVEIIADGQPLRCEVDEFDYKNKLKDIGEEIIVKSIVTKEQFNSIKYKLEE